MSWSEDFNRTDGIVGNGWQVSQWGIVSNQLKATSNGSALAYRLGAVDGSIQYTVVAFGYSSRGPVPVWRYQDNNNYYTFHNDINSQWIVKKIVGGVQTDIYTHPTFAAAANDVIRLDFNGSVFKLYRNGVMQFKVTDASLTSGAYVGILGSNVIGGDIIDDFSFTDLTAQPTTPTNLTVTGTTTTSVSLSWTDNATTETYYSIERRTSPAGTWIVLRDDLPANTTTYTDASVIPGTAYDYRVRPIR